MFRTKIARVLSVALLIAATAATATIPTTVEAGSRGRSRPYVKTPYGWIPKSVYNAPYVQNAATLERYRAAEQKMAGKFGFNPGNQTATKKPTTKPTIKK